MSFTATNTSWPWFVGAWYDIAGAILLAKSFLAATSNDLLAQSSSGYGGFSVYLLRTFCEQKVDARFAVVLLVIGFLLQGLAAVGVNIEDIRIAIGAAIPLFAILIVYVFLRVCLTRRYMKRAMSQSNNLDVEGLLRQAFENL